MNLACSRGEANEDGEHCPYVESAPDGVEARQVWEFARRCSGQIRVAGMGGIAGFDMSSVFAMADALGHDRESIALLFPWIEDGMVSAHNKRLKGNG